MFNFLKEVSFLIPDFLAIQRLSFSHFLEKGLIEEFQKKNPILNRKKKIKIIFFPKFYQLTTPKRNPDQAIVKSKTYASGFYIPIQKKFLLNSGLFLLTKYRLKNRILC